MKIKKNYLNRNFNKKRSNDLLTKPQRSNLMSKIRSKGTKLESEFIKALQLITRKKFQTNVTIIKGKPDIVFLKAKLCVFIDSDFWHGWYYPKWKHLLKDDFWREKIEKNRVRDKRNTAYLRNNGWNVLRFWEHQIKRDQEKVMSKIINNLK
jgi:DNA mismatch endonuclease Vsr